MQYRNSQTEIKHSVQLRNLLQVQSPALSPNASPETVLPAGKRKATHSHVDHNNCCGGERRFNTYSGVGSILHLLQAISEGLLEHIVTTQATRMRRPPSSIQSVILFTSKDDSDHWIPTKYEVGSWISLHPGERVLHAQESKRYGGTSLSGAYKARIVEFRVEGLRVSQVRVQHAYMYRQLKLDPAANQIHGACNYLYPSKFEDCVDPNSILGIIVVVHADIGEATRGIRTHKDLLGESLFFYNAFYILPQATGRYGQVVSIPLPPLDSLDWPLPDMATSEAFRSASTCNNEAEANDYKLKQIENVQLQARYGAVHVMVDLFVVADNIQRKPTMSIFKNPSTTLLESLMDEGWGSKVSMRVDIIRCTVDIGTLVYRYHVARSILYTKFEYNRSRFVDGFWENMDQIEVHRTLKVVCEMGEWREEIEAGEAWPLSTLREEILVAIGDDDMHDFVMHIVKEGEPTRKVNCRNEKYIQVRDACIPTKLQLVHKSN